MRLLTITFVVFFSTLLLAQPDSIVNELPRPLAVWENGFANRINQMWGSRIPNYVVNPGSGNADAGKSEWPKLLAQMAWPTQNSSSTSMKNFIDKGRQMVNGTYTGSFYSPFSCAGYAMYYFRWKDSIAKYDNSQLNLILNDVNQQWNKLVRTDHVFDPCCGYNAAGGKEFNSENFHWMLRTAGFLFAKEIHNRNIDGNILDMQQFNFNYQPVTIYTGTAGQLTKDIFPQKVNLIDFFEGYLKNLTRALYNAGRVEWNSNNYFGHTLNPLLTLYEGVDKCQDANAIANKKRIQACIDWMLVEAAIRYLDGFQVSADARAKTSSFLPFKGSYYQYTIPYFTENENSLSFSPTIWTKKDPSEAEIGFLLSSSYRPPQIVIDIAQRKFPLPVEIQSAKPFYHIDNGTFFNVDGTINSEFPYADWNGTGRGRRFEYETLWLDKNMTMASAAVGRPDGNMGTFSEQCVWRIGVKGQKNGTRMLSGNAGSRTTTAGRAPEWQVAQFRNTMMQMVKVNNTDNNKIWLVVPDSLKQLTTTGEGSMWDVMHYKWVGSDLYLNMGNGVFIAVKPYPEPIGTYVSSSSESTEHSVLTFKWAAGVLGSICIETATDNNFNGFSDFVTALSANKIYKTDANTLTYTSSMGNTLKMEYTPQCSYTMTPYTYDTPSPNPFSWAANYPKVWGNNQFIDYNLWDSYRTVYGFDVINQAWGSGVLTLKTDEKAARITVDKVNADVHFEIEKTAKNINSLQFLNTDENIKLVPNPAQNSFYVVTNLTVKSLKLFNINGKLIKNIDNQITMNISEYPKGIYYVLVETNKGQLRQKLIKS